LPEVTSPLYIFHGTEDRKVPYYLGKKLKNCNPDIQFVSVQGATHNDMQSMEVYKEEMDKILS